MNEAVKRGPEHSGLSGRVPELDGLRGLAILLVIICHYVANAEHAPLGFWVHRILSALTAGWSGVDLFLVLSGFLIGGILVDARNSPHYFRAFYMRRVHRILPIYYAWTVLFGVIVVGVLWVAPGRYQVSAADLQRIPVQVLFLQNVFIGMPTFQWMWFVVTWSLAIEEQFYLAAPPLIRFLRLRKVVWILAATVCLAPVLRFVIFHYWSPGSYLAAFLMPCRADALAAGMLLAIAWRHAGFRAYVEEHRLQLQRGLLGLSLGVGALLWWLAHPLNVVTVTIGYTALATFYACLLLVVLSQTGGWIAGVMRWRMLRGLGTVSYCVYIIHDTFNQLGHRIVLHAAPQIYDARGASVSLLAIALTLSVAVLSWRYFEKPLLRRGHGYSFWDQTGTAKVVAVPRLGVEGSRI